MELKLGDTVRLASGGPLMTVLNFLRNGKVQCAHFDGKTDHVGEFPPSALRVVLDPDDDPNDETPQMGGPHV